MLEGQDGPLPRCVIPAGQGPRAHRPSPVSEVEGKGNQPLPVISGERAERQLPPGGCKRRGHYSAVWGRGASHSPG